MDAYYLFPVQGTGLWKSDGRLDAFRPKYIELLDAIHDPTLKTGVPRVHVHSDPSVIWKNKSGGLALYAFKDIETRIAAEIAKYPDVVAVGNERTAREELKRLSSLNTKVKDLLDKIGGDDKHIDEVLDIRPAPLLNRHGTNTTDFTAADTTAWSAVTNGLTKTNLSGTDGKTTYDVLTNQGQAVATSGGGFYNVVDVHGQQAESAVDQLVTFTHVSGESGIEISIIGRQITSALDDFYMLENVNQSGNDTRLFRFNGGIATEKDTDTKAKIAASREFEIDISGSGATVTIEGRVWATSGSRPGTADITVNDADATRLTAAGYGGVYVKSERGAATIVIDDVAWTNNDVGGGGLSIPIAAYHYRHHLRSM